MHINTDIVDIMKPILWLTAAKRDLMEMPKDVIADFGYALFQAQLGEHPDIAKPLKGFGGAGVLELITNHSGDTYRAVYTVRYSDAIFVLHAFQKKSKRGIETPKSELELVLERLKRSEAVYLDWKKG